MDKIAADMVRGSMLNVRCDDPGDKLEKKLNVYVRLVSKSGREVARLPAAVGNLLAPLLFQSLVKLRVHVEFIPDKLAVFTTFGCSVEFFVASPRAFDCFTDGGADAQAKSILPDAMWRCLQVALGKLTPPGCYPTEFGNVISLLDDDDNDAASAAAAGPVDGEPASDNGAATPEDEEKQLAVEDALFGVRVRTDKGESIAMPTPAALQVKLRPYQAVAAGWMKYRESLEKEDSAMTRPSSRNPLWDVVKFKDGTPFYVNNFTFQATLDSIPAVEPCRGGILADSMGMGKTISTLALLLSDSRKDRRPGTLIVAPTSLIAQWEAEIESKVDLDDGTVFQVVMYHGSGRESSALDSADVVLTTFGTLASDYAKKQSTSKLFTTQWRRVVLDEAHVIRNGGTGQAKAALALKADGRWCLTGTPVHNSINDLQILFQFIKLEPWNQSSFWKRAIEKPHLAGDPQAMERLKAVLNDGPILLRRTMDQIDPATGKEIVELPPLDIQVVELDFTKPERDFYTSIFNRSKLQFEGLVASGHGAQSTLVFLSLLIRLRQACDHPYVVLASRQETTEDAIKADKDYISRVANKYFAGQGGLDVAKSAMRAVAKGGDEAECPICLIAMADPVLTRCAHTTCRRCLIQSLSYFGASLCPICRAPVNKSEIVSVALPSRASGVVDDSGALVGCSASELIASRFVPSSKLERVAAEVQAARARGDKVLVFSQFLTTLDLIEASLKRAEPPVKFVRLDGHMNVGQRKRTLAAFKDDAECSALVMSLKVGCLGLNITAANVVILVEPWWNSSVEMQAVGRCHRIGQQRPVRVLRLVMKDSVEQQMHQVQLRKNNIVDALGLLGTGGGELDEQSAKLTLEDFSIFFQSARRSS